MAGGEAGFHEDAEEAHTWRSGLNSGKLDRQVQPHQPPTQLPACPECGSQRTWKDGVRYTNRGEVQRYICRACGYRFSETSWNGPDESEDVERVHTTALYSVQALPINRQVCVTEVEGTKNLAEVESRTQKWAAGATETKATEPSEAELKGKIVELAWRLKKQGYREATIRGYIKNLERLMKRGANLFDPENVKDVIARQESWSEATKSLVVAAYAMFAGVNNISWQLPRYKQTRKLPFIPLESEIDALIAGCGRKAAVLLQLLKETGMRPGEACALTWRDIDVERNTITVNNPEKGSNPRVFRTSNKLMAMLNALPKNYARVFGDLIGKKASELLWQARKRVAAKLQNPRINYIKLYTLRHWKATMEYAKTKDILHVMKMLGHRNINNTLIYTQLISFETDEYHSAMAENVEEARKLIEVGFEYVCTYENKMIFRKRR